MAVSVTTTLQEGTAALLDRVASALGRSRDAIIEDAIREHALNQVELLDLIAVGEQDIDEGRCYDRQQMDTWFAEKIAAFQPSADRSERA